VARASRSPDGPQTDQLVNDADKKLDYAASPSRASGGAGGGSNFGAEMSS
jgi:hypothetical protein